MTQLIFLGEELDPTKEHELLIDPNDHLTYDMNDIKVVHIVHAYLKPKRYENSDNIWWNTRND